MSLARPAIPLIIALIASAGTPAFAAKAASPFCLPGEKKVCTLGPPPVCSCKPSNQSIQRGSARKATTAN